MVQITVSEELARAITASELPVVLVDPQGRKLGQMTQIDYAVAEEARITDDHLAEIERRIAADDGVRYTTAEVMAHLRSLAPE